MAASVPAPTIPSEHSAVPAVLPNACFVLCVVNVSFFPAPYLSH